MLSFLACQLLFIGVKWLKEEFAMKKRLPIDPSILEFFILIFLAMASLLYLNGCAITPKAIQFAQEKASPHYKYWNIKSVQSAVEQDNGDISFCVELNNGITITPSALSGRNDLHERLGLDSGEYPLSNTLYYWYPIERVESGCDKITQGNLSTKSILPIEKLIVDSQDQLNDLLNSYNNSRIKPNKILEVRYVSKDISIIYWFARIDHQTFLPINIAGVYEDKSTNLYYLTVPAAFIGDVIIVVAVTAVVIAGIALGVYLQLQ
jgi:hypothetical protein